MHRMILYHIDKARADLEKTTEGGPPCDQMRTVEQAFANYQGPAVPFFDEWKALFVSMESDVMGLVCVNDKFHASTAFDNFEIITRSSYKSFCGSDEVLTPMDPEEGMRLVNSAAPHWSHRVCKKLPKRVGWM